MTFDDSLILEEVPGSENGRQLYKLLEPLTFGGTYGDEMRIGVKVPAGFLTDFASVPRILWSIFPPAGRWNKAAVVHDYLCESETCSRFLADAIFRECMRELNVPRWRRVAMYWAVRAYSIVMGLR